MSLDPGCGQAYDLLPCLLFFGLMFLVPPQDAVSSCLRQPIKTMLEPRFEFVLISQGEKLGIMLPSRTGLSRSVRTGLTGSGCVEP